MVPITMGKRLVGSVRACDTVARLGGDEFVLLIEDIENRQELTQIGKLLENPIGSDVFECGCCAERSRWALALLCTQKMVSRWSTCCIPPMLLCTSASHPGWMLLRILKNPHERVFCAVEITFW